MSLKNFIFYNIHNFYVNLLKINFVFDSGNEKLIMYKFLDHEILHERNWKQTLLRLLIYKWILLIRAIKHSRFW